MSAIAIQIWKGGCYALEEVLRLFDRAIKLLR
jgi:hypothetical protein